MKSIAIVIPYYGKFPNYFDFWVESAKYNTTIDFYVVTDIEGASRYNSKNVKVINLALSTIKERISEIVGFECTLDEPYKLCDYKPAYGLIFSELLESYDCWGYCDVDTILGDIRMFVNKEIMHNYDKYYFKGHLTIFNNNEINNYLFMSENKNDYSYKEVFRTKYPCHFDETAMDIICNNNGLRTYREYDYVDLEFRRHSFVDVNKRHRRPQIFMFDHGKLLRIVGRGESGIEAEPICYVHMQKRKIDVCATTLGYFLVVPNKIVDVETVDNDFVTKHSVDQIEYKYYLWRIKDLFNRFGQDGIRQRLLQIKWRYYRNRE